jgi:hypothetical protein
MFQTHKQFKFLAFVPHFYSSLPASNFRSCMKPFIHIKPRETREIKSIVLLCSTLNLCVGLVVRAKPFRPAAQYGSITTVPDIAHTETNQSTRFDFVRARVIVFVFIFVALAFIQYPAVSTIPFLIFENSINN